MRKSLFLFALCTLAHAGFAQQLADRDYADLLRKSITFFEAQACGPDVQPYSSFDWRGSCHTGDGNDIGIDLTGGWHDAGDHVKFNYPMGQAVYNLASLYVDYREQIDDTGNKDSLLKQLRFISDYMIRCHPEPDKYVIQIAEGVVDHTFWQVPEEQGPGRENNYTRTTFMADTDHPNTNLACANAAAFAALSMAFREVDDAYSAELLQHAEDLYDFGYDNLASYNDSGFGNPLPGNPDGETYQERGEFNFYKDFNGYQDEIMVGAAWLYRATGVQRYKNEAETAFATLGDDVGDYTLAWGDHQFEAAIQMARATGEAKYLDALGDYVEELANGSIWLTSESGGLRVPTSGGFSLPLSLGGASVAYRYAELVGSSNLNYSAARDFAFSQFNYALGSNPKDRSYVVDFGNDFPQITHHRAAHSPEGGSGLINTNPVEDTHTITGALVMGPRLDDEYNNVRTDITATEVALGNNAILAVCAALMVKETDATDNPPTSDSQSTYNNNDAPWLIADGTLIQAEDYDRGGQGVAYNDNTPGSNAGQQYRTEGVDIGTTADGTTYVGWTEPGEWLEYTVDVTAGTYDIQVAMASPEDNRTLRIKLGDQTLGTVDCPNSSEGFEDFRTATLSGVTLPAGEQVLRLEMVDGSFNIGAFSFTEVGSPATGNVTVRAKGTTGSEQIEVRYNDELVGQPITLSPSFEEYSVPVDNPNGNFKVAFINDDGSRDAEIDWLQVGTTKRQAETRSTNTAVWQNNSCGGSNSQIMNCNGYIDFGSFTSASPSGTVVVRAKGSVGSEQMSLLVDGQTVKSWTVAVNPANYVYEGYRGGSVALRFDNDGSPNGQDRNLAINYLDVCGDRQQAEGASNNASAGCSDTFSGFVWLWCNATLDFGNVGCNSNTRTVAQADKPAPEVIAGAWFRSYPNPVSEQLTVEGNGDYQVTLYDLSGQAVMQHDHLRGSTTLDVGHLRPGIYIIKMHDRNQHEIHQRVVVK